jgi:predicted RNA polymerase sigma factor
LVDVRDFVARYPHALAMYAELHASLGHMAEARVCLDRALEQRTSASERTLLLRKRAALGRIIVHKRGSAVRVAIESPFEV